MVNVAKLSIDLNICLLCVMSHLMPNTMTKPIAGHIMPNEHMTTPATAISLLGLDFTRATMPSINPTTDAGETIANIVTMPDSGTDIDKGVNNIRQTTRDIIPRIIAAIAIFITPWLYKFSSHSIILENARVGL